MFPRKRYNPSRACFYSYRPSQERVAVSNRATATRNRDATQLFLPLKNPIVSGPTERGRRADQLRTRRRRPGIALDHAALPPRTQTVPGGQHRDTLRIGDAGGAAAAPGHHPHHPAKVPRRSSSHQQPEAALVQRIQPRVAPRQALPHSLGGVRRHRRHGEVEHREDF